jgi:hypothetical protein
VTIELSSAVPNQIELTTGLYKAFGNCASPQQQAADPDVSGAQYTVYKASNFYKTYTLALDTQYTAFNCYKPLYRPLVNSAVIYFRYADESIDIVVLMDLLPQNQDGSAPTLNGQALRKIGNTNCYFMARMQARLYDQVASLSAGQLPQSFSWNKATQSCAYRVNAVGTQRKWEISTEPTAWCGSADGFSSWATGFWNQNYAPSGLAFQKVDYADIGGDYTQTTSATMSGDFPTAARLSSTMVRYAGTRFFTTDTSKKISPCGSYGNSFVTATVFGLDSSNSTAESFIQITPPQ